MTVKFSFNSESQNFILISANPLAIYNSFPIISQQNRRFRKLHPQTFLKIVAERTRFNFVLIGRDLTLLGSLNVRYNLICFLSIERGLCLLPLLSRGFSTLDRWMKYGSTAKEMRQKHPHNNHSFLSWLK